MNNLQEKMNILIVDDHSSMRRILKRFIVDEKFGDLFEANNGQDALELMNIEKIDFIISDLNMPIMDGLEFLKRVKINPATHDIPFIMVSVEASQKIMNKALGLGVDSYIVKPFTANQLLEEIRRVKP